MKDVVLLDIYKSWQGLYPKVLHFQVAGDICCLAKKEEEFPFLKKDRR